MAKYAKPHTPSLLRDKSYAAMRDFSFDDIVREAELKCPDILDVLASVCVREKGNSVPKDVEHRVPAIGTIFGMLMHQFNQELNLVQRVNTVLLAAGHAEKKVNKIITPVWLYFNSMTTLFQP